jgi:glycosyltransferase involved in cell wall biosynthesis
MRVLFVHNFYQIPGGEDTVVRAELAMLAREGITVELFSVHNDDIRGMLGGLRAALNVVYNSRARRALSETLKRFSPDVVHIHNFFPLLSPSIFDACLAAGVPSVMTLHNFRLLSPGALLHPSEAFVGRNFSDSCWWSVPRRVYRNSAAATAAVAAMIEFHKWAGTWTRKVSRFIALTEWAKQLFVEGGLPADRIVIKPNCIARPPAFDVGRREGALFVGRLSEEKGVDILLRAWKHSKYPLKIIGDGPLSHFVEQNVGEQIVYLGRQPADVVNREMRAARFLVLPSTGDMFPMTIVESFSNGLPVICSDLPSLGCLVEHGVTGLKFTAGDADSLAGRVAWASSNEAALDEMGRRAHTVYEAHYTAEINVARLLDIYATAMEAPGIGHLPRSFSSSRPRATVEP